MQLVYYGNEEGPGHFKLTWPEVKGRATLQYFKDDNVLDGWWLEDGYDGMWQVSIDK